MEKKIFVIRSREWGSGKWEDYKVFPEEEGKKIFKALKGLEDAIPFTHGEPYSHPSFSYYKPIKIGSVEFIKVDREFAGVEVYIDWMNITIDRGVIYVNYDGKEYKIVRRFPPERRLSSFPLRKAQAIREEILQRFKEVEERLKNVRTVTCILCGRKFYTDNMLYKDSPNSRFLCSRCQGNPGKLYITPQERVVFEDERYLFVTPPLNEEEKKIVAEYFREHLKVDVEFKDVKIIHPGTQITWGRKKEYGMVVKHFPTRYEYEKILVPKLGWKKVPVFSKPWKNDEIIIEVHNQYPEAYNISVHEGSEGLGPYKVAVFEVPAKKKKFITEDYEGSPCTLKKEELVPLKLIKGGKGVY